MKYEIRRQKEIELMDSVDLETQSDKKARLEDKCEDEKESELNEARERQVFDPLKKVKNLSLPSLV